MWNIKVSQSRFIGLWVYESLNELVPGHLCTGDRASSGLGAAIDLDWVNWGGTGSRFLMEWGSRWLSAESVCCYSSSTRCSTGLKGVKQWNRFAARIIISIACVPHRETLRIEPGGQLDIVTIAWVAVEVKPLVPDSSSYLACICTIICIHIAGKTSFTSVTRI